jgi:hypothetical protein
MNLRAQDGGALPMLLSLLARVDDVELIASVMGALQSLVRITLVSESETGRARGDRYWKHPPFISHTCAFFDSTVLSTDRARKTLCSRRN